VKAGGTTSITFRNVFAETTTFQFSVDNAQFHVAKPSDSIRARKEHKIAVSYTYDSKDSCKTAPPATARLVVSCARSAATGVAPASQVAPNIQWIYYLKGVAADGKDAK